MFLYLSQEPTVWISLTILGIVYLSFLLKRDSRVKKFIEQIHGPSTLPVLGNALSFLNVPNHELIGLFQKWVREYGGFFRVWLVNRAYVACCSADVVEKVLSSTVHIDKSDDYDVLNSWLGTGLLTASGKKWFSRRKLLTPTFHFKILEDFIDIFNEQSRVLTDVLKTERCNGDKFDIFPYVTRCALDIICETAMGKKIHAQRKHNVASYVNAIYGINEILLQRLIRIWLRIDLVWRFSPQGRAEKKYLKILHKFTEDVIEERKRERRSEKSKTTQEDTTEASMFETKKRKAFLDLLLEVSEDGKVLSDLDIREEVDTFMFEGHDTTSANINFTLFLLASYPKYQKRVQQELEEIFGSDNKERDVTSNDMTRMKFLECCIKEALRLYPSVPMLTRTLKQDLLLQDGKQIVPAGTTTVVVPFILHRDPKVFPEPEKFDPERFLPENSIGRHPFAYVPFSAGPRNCIGQKFALLEEKAKQNSFYYQLLKRQQKTVVLSHVLRKFQLEAVDSRESIQLLPDIILRPKNGLHIKISERK